MKLQHIIESKNCPSCGKPFKKDEPYPDVENCEVCERYGPPKELKEEFCPNAPMDQMWRERKQDAQKEFDISFDTENDDKVAERDIKVGDNKFYCELWKAGGDWQESVCYFRCELKDGYIEAHSKYSDPHFVFIPGPDEGNPHLVRTDNGKWSAPDHDDVDDDAGSDEELCWKSVEKYLKNLE